MTTQIVKIDAPELQAIEASKAEQIKSTFEPMVVMLADFESAYSEVLKEVEQEITQEVTIKAKRLGLDIGKVRIETEKLRKEQKEEYLRAGKAVDEVSNILKWAVIDKENKLKEIEDYFEIQEQKRLNELQAKRVALLLPYVEDAQERKLNEMDEDVWNAYFNAKKKEYEDRIAAEKKAEEERITKEKAEKEEAERISKENEILKKEAEEREKLAKIEEEKRKKAEEARIVKEQAERIKRELEQKKEREAYEAKLKAEREERERIEKEEKLKREKLETEVRAIQEAERKAKEQEELRIQTELAKGDADKVIDLIEDLKTLKIRYVFKSNKNKKMYENVGLLIDKIIIYIND